MAEKREIRAEEWQGGDSYAGIDSYERVQMKKGDIVCALVSYDKDNNIRPCSYFFPPQELEDVRNNSAKLNEGFQIAPWKAGWKTFTYRNNVVAFELKQDMVVQRGTTTENPAYGNGGKTQIFIPKEKFHTHLQPKKFGEAVMKVVLSNNHISKRQYNQTKRKHEQVQLRRNLFCLQKALLNVMEMKSCGFNLGMNNGILEKLKNQIRNTEIKIQRSEKKFKPIPSPLYDDLNKNLREQIKFRENNPDVLFLKSVKILMDEDKGIKNIRESNGLMINIVEDQSDKVADILYDKISQYKDPRTQITEENGKVRMLGKYGNEIDVEGQKLMDLSGIIRQYAQFRNSEGSQSYDYSKCQEIALQMGDGTIAKKPLGEMFTQESVERIQSSKNGHLSGLLRLGNGLGVKMLMRGTTPEFYVMKSEADFQNMVKNLPISEDGKKELMKGYPVVKRDNTMDVEKLLVKDMELNCVVTLPYPKKEGAKLDEAKRMTQKSNSEENTQKVEQTQKSNKPLDFSGEKKHKRGIGL